MTMQTDRMAIDRRIMSGCSSLCPRQGQHFVAAATGCEMTREDVLHPVAVR